MYSNVSVLKMAAQVAPFTVYTVYPIPRVRASYPSRSPNSVTFITQVRVNVSCS